MFRAAVWKVLWLCSQYLLKGVSPRLLGVSVVQCSGESLVSAGTKALPPLVDLKVQAAAE